MANKLNNQIRIISGKWKGRKITFPPSLPVRPTADRTRETLFNWLTPFIHNSVCLDLFAGTGSLGFEALSRGAKRLLCVDQSNIVIKHLVETAKLLNANNFDTVQLSIPSLQITKINTQFDIIFLDPPFKKEFIHQSIEWINNNNLLKKNAIIYVECEQELIINCPASWQLTHSKSSGTTKYQLYRYSG